MAAADDNAFLEAIPPFTDFREVARRDRYRPLPDEWLVGAADVVDSTGALAAGRYKAVNTVGASVISAVMNLDRHRRFPFVFGGDGAAFAVPADRSQSVAAALAACRVWAQEEIGLSLRAALAPVADIRKAGRDVRVARFSPSPHVSYAMFAGGGIAWTDAEMKAGRYEVPPARPGIRPDLTGLSCRWKPIAARKGEILSLLVTAGPNATAESFEAVVEAIDDLLADAGGGSPVAPEGPDYAWPPPGIDLEARACSGTRSRWRYYPVILAIQAIPVVLQALGRRLKNFDPVRYRRVTAGNSDFRKFDDGLKMTVDCSSATIDEIEKILKDGRNRGVVLYGLHQQNSALMTCIVPSPLTDDHLHFIDGAAGGYAMAAVMLKRMMAEAAG